MRIRTRGPDCPRHTEDSVGDRSRSPSPRGGSVQGSPRHLDGSPPAAASRQPNRGRPPATKHRGIRDHVRHPGVRTPREKGVVESCGSQGWWRLKHDLLVVVVQDQNHSVGTAGRDQRTERVSWPRKPLLLVTTSTSAVNPRSYASRTSNVNPSRRCECRAIAISDLSASTPTTRPCESTSNGATGSRFGGLQPADKTGGVNHPLRAASASIAVARTGLVVSLGGFSGTRVEGWSPDDPDREEIEAAETPSRGA